MFTRCLSVDWLAVVAAALLLSPAGVRADSIDLGDIAVGGDGTGPAPLGQGLSFTTGQLVGPNQCGGFGTAPASIWVRTNGTGGAANIPFVNGVFVPRAVIQIDSTGRTHILRSVRSARPPNGTGTCAWASSTSSTTAKTSRP